MMIKTHNICLMDLKQLTIALTCAPFFSFTTHANEQARVWSRIGPEGADINQIVISPSQPNTLYAATNPATYYSTSNEYILKSLNGGDSWVTLPWQGTALRPDDITANRTHQNYSAYFYHSPEHGRRLAVDPDNAEIVFTSLSGFLLKTSNSGMSWRSSGKNIDLNSDSFFLMNSIISPSLSALVLPDNEIANSTDSGKHWELSEQNINTTIQQTIEPSGRYPEGESNIQLLTTAPGNSTVLYGYTTLRHRSALATAPALLYKSTDEGQNWLNITPSGYQYLGGKLAFDPDNSEVILSIFAKSEDDSFAATIDQDLIMKSEDGGISWQALSIPTAGTTKYDVTDIYLDPGDKNTLYANIRPDTNESTVETKVIAKSEDQGVTWDIINTSPYFPGTIAIDPSNNKKLFMASKQGVLLSGNGGLNWTLSNRGIKHIGGKLSIAQGDNLTMYLAGNDRGSVIDRSVTTGFYYKSVDGGQQWGTFLTSPVVSGYCQEFKVNPTDNQDILCITDENIYQSLDGGEQWAFLKASNSRQLVRAQDGLTIYVSDSTGTSKSEDNGKSWNTISSFFEGELSIHPGNQSILYYLLDNKLHTSTDGGAQWSTLEAPTNIAAHHLLIHPSNPDVMALYGYYGYSLTEDGGQSWRLVLETVNNGDPEVNSFPTEFNYISQLVFNPANTNGLFLKTHNGVYESTDLGAHWELRHSGIESYISNAYIDVNLLTSSHDVYVDAPTGIFKLTEKVDHTAVADCIFNWVEQESADQYAPTSAMTEQWNGYTFRYYSQTNTYFGIFHDQEIHQLQANSSDTIIPQDSIASYQKLSGCSDMRFKL